MSLTLFKEKLFVPEDKKWVRVLESFMALLPAWTCITLFIGIKLPIDNRLLKLSYWGSLLASPFIAYLMYRNSDLFKIERLAILIIMVAVSLSILVASLGNQNL